MDSRKEELDDFDELLESSSLGSASARSLRERTPYFEVAEVLIERERTAAEQHWAQSGTAAQAPGHLERPRSDHVAAAYDQHPNYRAQRPVEEVKHRRSDGVLRGVVAVDGPSGTGKSTTARGLALRLDARYLDTGAMYRTATLAVLRAGVPLDSRDTADGRDEVAAVVVDAVLELSTDPGEPGVRLDGEDVGAEIRGSEVTAAVAAVSALSVVRAHLIEEQRQIVAEAIDDGRGIVVEGRDIGTVVVPDADLKIFLTASEMVRAGRRTAEDTAAGRSAAPDARSDLARRDRLDSSRAASPLRPADDAVEIDTSTLDIDGVLARLQDLAEDRGLVVVGEPALI